MLVKKKHTKAKISLLFLTALSSKANRHTAPLKKKIKLNLCASDRAVFNLGFVTHNYINFTGEKVNGYEEVVS